MKFTKKEYLYFIMGVILLSFGVTIPFGAGIIIAVITKKIQEAINESKETSEINTDFVN